ncbi:5-formyltetrahydrofolate cyclo-ligase [Pacificibacter marinus]|uniref:5-formyltetrahydrofolate cyclo-ligase n=1 Tax=Pacificibacter marinus TaxID=658057 RepID=A0A1Y5SJX2_9RHOB|nr:5-formyltetrahydrofolate cyclo-ligase [Pacificibacter marinus]SEK59092.1 5-formyltetrahydrofolate cyclo-ligase [Pacificibacter marinus]SLN42513.1 putative 5-formyltetrahydrofolate cyclo-ligase [Pacificibacter marinus]
MVDVSVDLKAIARKRALEQRGIAHLRDQERAAQAGALLTGFLTPYFGKVIAGYMPIKSEIDPLPAMHFLSKQGPVAVPVVEAKATPLRFDTWTPKAQMVAGAYGAQVPKVSKPVVPDVLIVPLVAFNRAGHRLGYGGGFYDRTLAKLRETQDVFAVGFAYSGQEMSDFPVTQFDVPLDAIVTEAEVFTL